MKMYIQKNRTNQNSSTGSAFLILVGDLESSHMQILLPRLHYIVLIIRLVGLDA